MSAARGRASSHRFGSTGAVGLFAQGLFLAFDVVFEGDGVGAFTAAVFLLWAVGEKKTTAVLAACTHAHHLTFVGA